MLTCALRANGQRPIGDDVPTALQDYVSAADDSFDIKVLSRTEHAGCTIYDIDLTSQVWHGITWRHAMSGFVPADVHHQGTVFLFVTGGKNGSRPDEEDLAMGIKLARLLRMPCVSLHQVPNQPLLGDRVEDDLISETFLKYLDTKDPTWPLLFPMVKSVVRAMDAIQQISLAEYCVPVDRFVVAGASKRGWTTWLSAVADRRIAGIAPIVIDTLNFRPQMDYQLETWGAYSEQIADYTSKGLVDVLRQEPDGPLWRWVDPYTYRKQLSLPKLLINGTNDRYWALDAMKHYWDGLSGEKYIRYVPNAGHGLDDGREAAFNTLAAFAQHVAMRKPLPKLDWEHADDNDGNLRLSITSDATPRFARVWLAHAGGKDFRHAKWTAQPIELDDGNQAVATIRRPDSGHVALFGEVSFDFNGLDYSLSTTIRRE